LYPRQKAVEKIAPLAVNPQPPGLYIQFMQGLQILAFNVSQNMSICRTIGMLGQVRIWMSSWKESTEQLRKLKLGVVQSVAQLGTQAMCEVWIWTSVKNIEQLPEPPTNRIAGAVMTEVWLFRQIWVFICPSAKEFVRSLKKLIEAMSVVIVEILLWWIHTALI
jgi:hypothetical protein